ncbi:MAG: beta-galactosidase [Bryobacteraceae bacterium]
MKQSTLILFFAAALAAQGGGLPVSVWYGGGKARAPMLEPDPRAKKELWREDIRKIRGLGFRAFRCWVDWASAEPEPGRYDFSTLDVLLELAEEEGMRVFVQVYMDSAPEWVGRRHPDSLFVSSNGQAVAPESSPGYCRDHPGVRAADNAFYRALARHASRSKALLGWDLWSEPHVINWANPTYIPNPEFCFCANTKRRFREWLRRKYGSLEALNRAWYRRYRAWEEVEPNRLSTILSYTDYIDWKMFIADKLGEDLRERYEAVKAEAPEAVATSHAAGVGLFASPHWWEGQSDDWIMARQVDFYGTSFYPKHSAFVDRDPMWRGALLDFTRSFGFAEGRKGFVIGELQAGFGTIAVNVSPEVTPEDLRIWAWSAVSRGAKGIHFYAFYPMSTGYEAGGFGLIHLDGTLTERAREAGRFAQAVARHEKLLEEARPPRAEVAVIYNPLAHFVGGRQRQTAYGGPQGEVAGIERDSLLGFYKALWAENVPVDFVHAGALSKEALAQYRLVYLPYPPMLPSYAGGVLREYVQAGGRLVAEARAGWNSEAGRASEIIPGMGLHEVFGAREAAVETATGGRTVIVFEGGLRVPGRWFREVLAPMGGNVVGRFEDGAPAAVEAAYGKGKALLVGSYPSAAYHSAPGEDARRWFVSLLDWAGVRRELIAEGGVEARWLESGGGRIVFVFNHGHDAKQVRLRWREEGAWRITDLLQETPGHAQFELSGKNVAVLLFEKRER